MINSLLKPILSRLPENNRLEMIWKLAQVDFKKRYYNDKLGLLWALLNPLFKIAIYYMVFTYVMDRGRENFAIFLFAGLLIFMAFTEAASKGLTIIQSKKYLLENIQFNKIDLFTSSIISVFLGFSFNLVAYTVILLGVGIKLGSNFLFLPVLLVNVFILCLGASLILATIQIYLKDIKHLWAIIVIATFWSSGIFFPAEAILEKFPEAVYLNPLIGIIDNMREITMNNGSPNFSFIIINYITSIVILIIGLFSFKRFSHKAIELM